MNNLVYALSSHCVLLSALTYALSQAPLDHTSHTNITQVHLELDLECSFLVLHAHTRKLFVVDCFLASYVVI